VARICDSPGQAINQANSTIQGGKYQGTQVRGYFTTGEVGANRETGSRRKTELF
jgi:hypothetical protein